MIKPDCIQTKTVLCVTWTDCPEDVKAEVKRLWKDREAGNGCYYIQWDSEEDCENYPIIAKYLESRNIKECLIHYW